MLTIIYAILVFGLLIGVHEAGHLVAAKLVGVTVYEFAIGMGPKIFSFTKGGTKYSLRIFPIGGFCKMDGEDETSENEGALCNKTVWQRLFVVASGAIMNVILGFLIYVISVSVYSPAIGTNSIESVIPDSPAYFAGIMAGDKIVEIDSANVYTPSDINFEIYTQSADEFEVTFKRDGKKIKRFIKPALYIESYEGENGEILGGYFADTNTPKEIKDAYGRYLIGCTFSYEDKTFLGVIKSALCQSRSTVRVVFYSLKMLITGQVGVNDVSGPVGIVEQIGTSAKSGLYSLLMLVALITINLGVFNLLPVPALDGGRVFFLIVEIIRRKPIPPEKEGAVHFVGLALLLLLMLVVTANDILKIFR